MFPLETNRSVATSCPFNGTANAVRLGNEGPPSEFLGLSNEAGPEDSSEVMGENGVL